MSKSIRYRCLRRATHGLLGNGSGLRFAQISLSRLFLMSIGDLLSTAQ